MHTSKQKENKFVFRTEKGETLILNMTTKVPIFIL